MSFTNVNQINGFNATQYNQLLEAAKSEYVSKEQIDQALLAAVNAGKTFSQALSSISAALPTLPPPMGTGALWDNGLAGLPSFCANYLALVGDLAADQRRQSAEQRALQTNIIVDTIEAQAEEMRDKAVFQLCMGIASGLLSIAQGLMSYSMMSSGTAENAKITDTAARGHADMLLNTKVQSFNSAAGGTVGTVGSISQAVSGMYDAEIKLMDADIERARAQTDALKSLEESLRELIQKMLSTMDSIQQSTNQTRTRILG
ncbi:MAG: type III secretion system protein [Deltaproteobacteria bacterium]|nr:type III secretion system protein [Deltaproteobacteria bacterium]